MDKVNNGIGDFLIGNSHHQYHCEVTGDLLLLAIHSANSKSIEHHMAFLIDQRMLFVSPWEV